jgi:sugar/nucleoside kinase (ribokinase family)
MDRLLVIGNISVDQTRYPDGRRGSCVGGAALLLSLAAARAGLRAVPVAIVGDDLARLPQALGVDGLDSTGIRHAEGATASFDLDYDVHGELLSVDSHYGVAEELTAHALAFLARHGSDAACHVCCRRPLDAAAVLAELTTRDAAFSVDFFLPSAHDMVRRAAPWLPRAATVFVNAAEYRLLSAAVDTARLPEVVITDGPRAARVLRFGLEAACVTPPSREPRDVVGAGDTLAGTFLAHRLRGVPPGQALSHAAATAAEYVAAPPVPLPSPRI